MREWIDALEDRTRAFAVSVTKSASHVESSFTLREHARQLVRAAGSVAANHRAMRRARSTKEFASKLQIVAEETDECVLWLELLRDAGAPQPAEIQRLLSEALELRAIFKKSKSTLRHKRGATESGQK